MNMASYISHYTIFFSSESAFFLLHPIDPTSIAVWKSSHSTATL
jgi:hypothetical protein